jgi:alkyl hydroperoxide reductase subunit AhpC
VLLPGQQTLKVFPCKSDGNGLHSLSNFFTPKIYIMSLRLGDVAPNFQATTSEGSIDFYEYLGNSWGVLFSHPADYTPVCTTELGKTALLKGEFEKRNVKVLALSVDPVDKHKGWINDINETQNVTVDFPIIADADKTIANMYGMIHPNASETFTVRSLFVIGPDKKVKLMITYPASTGRNFYEVLRVIDSLQLTANYSVATPADWKEGEDVIVVPAVSTEDAIQKFPKGVKIVKPYLRYTPQPNK